VARIPSQKRLLAEQIEYYRARAPEYDDWFLRRGHYDHGPELAAVWERETAGVESALASLPLDGADVLELAPGTGNWTARYAVRAASVTAVDASPEMVERAKVRLGALAAKVDFVFADLFAWQPPRRYDAVVMGFWISHVPASRLDGFLGTVRDALRPNAGVFFVDTRPVPSSGRAGQPPPRGDGEIQRRRLDDGREFDVVKNYWDPAELREHCEAAGLDVDVRETATYFLYGIGRRSS
jgi:SAM-dependent methyltransferase